MTFDSKGFRYNVHVLEHLCSWDGFNYLKSNCSTKSSESRITFTRPDDVARAYHIKSGTASRDLTAHRVPKTYMFGVKVLDDNGNLTPAAKLTFKMRASTSPPVGGTQVGGGTVELKKLGTIKLTFNSITVHNDHALDPTVYTHEFRGTLGFPVTTVLPGDWNFYAYVQGKLFTPY